MLDWWRMEESRRCSAHRVLIILCVKSEWWISSHKCVMNYVEIRIFLKYFIIKNMKILKKYPRDRSLPRGRTQNRDSPVCNKVLRESRFSLSIRGLRRWIYTETSETEEGHVQDYNTKWITQWGSNKNIPYCTSIGYWGREYWRSWGLWTYSSW